MGEPHLPVTGSVDVRHWVNHNVVDTTAISPADAALCQIAAVDTNRFPAGFNHVSSQDYEKAVQILRKEGQEAGGMTADRIHVVTEPHTRMLAYYESVEALKAILKKAFPEKKISSSAAFVNNDDD